MQDRRGEVALVTGLLDTIRMAGAGDAREIAEIYAPVVAGSAISFEVEPPGAEQMQARLESALRVAPWLVGVESGRVVGYAYASRHRERAAYQWSVDVSVYVREGHRRGGVGRALYTSLFALLYLQGFYSAHAGVTLPNPASVRLHESMGFRPIGVYPKVGFKQGAWHDVGWWQLPLRDRTGAPAPPLTMDALRASPAFASALMVGAKL